MVGNACSNASATLTISFTANAPDAGTSGTLNLCGSAAPVALISGLGGTPDATGTWTRQSTGATVPANFDPATGTPGVFVYTVPGTAGCPSVSSTVTVTVTPAANAGTNGTLSVCA
ncbi:MAG: hypothetical protein JST98_08590, partial [Bacteroidetes bacterium]|nr:hypothetical protein [Bacteroidota bacterium]